MSAARRRASLVRVGAACATALCLLLALGRAWAVELPPRIVNPNDTLVLTDGTTLLGSVVERRADGLMFQELGKSGKTFWAKDKIAQEIPRQNAADVVTRRGGMEFQKNDQAGLRRTLDWGRQNEAGDAVLALAMEVVKAQPGNTEIGELLLTLLLEKQQAAEVESVAKGLLAANQMFDPAYEALARIYQDQQRAPELTQLADTWLNVRPTSPTANRLRAESAELAGELRKAQEAYRKLAELHKDVAASAGWARTSLKLGDHAVALKAAAALIAAGQSLPEAKAIAGSAKLALGETAAAADLLREAVDAGVTGEMGGIARYNLGLAYWRGGLPSEARALWSGLELPAAALALALVDHQPFPGQDALTQKPLQDVAIEHNACLALEAQNFQRGLAGLNPKTNARHQFLVAVAEVLKTSGRDSSLRALAAVSGPESLRWQAYGLILARKYKEAETLLGQLPETDGYAAVYRVYVAAAQRDEARARELFARLATAPDAPKDYVAVLANEYAGANDELFVEEFDWNVSGDSLASGWQSSAPGTNIRIHNEAKQLVFAGAQTVSADAVSRAWRVVPAERMRMVQVTLDLAKVGTAQVGLELLDETRANGIAYGVIGDNKLGWRTLAKGAWGAWEELPLPQVQGVQAVLRLELNGGRVFAVPTDNPTQRRALGQPLLPSGGLMCVAVFGSAEPGTEWRLAADSLHIQLRPQAGGGARK